MDNRDKVQMTLMCNDASKHLANFIKNIEDSPNNAYEDLHEARNLINKVVDRMFVVFVEN